MPETQAVELNMAVATENGIDAMPVDSPKNGIIPGEHLDMELSKELVSLVWGSAGPQKENLHRWSQGFVFSPTEPTALVQHFGGPCAVIVPVQAYLLKNAVFPRNYDVDQGWGDKNGPEMLVAAFIDILSMLSSDAFYLVLPSQVLQIPSKRDAATMNADSEPIAVDESPDSPPGFAFHSELRYKKLDSIEDTKRFLQDHTSLFTSSYGVLRFLYSAILTKTLPKFRDDLEDPTEPLIDSTHGHGNQSMINFLISGSPVSNLWDNEKDFGSLKLKGIPSRPAVGFLSLLENMRYVEVGFYLKCPKYPIWILASETHLSILFTLIPTLVTSEAEESEAIRLFRRYDEHGSGFISADNLKDILAELNLFQEEEYVNSLKSKLDKEQLGIIVRSDFLAEFFPGRDKYHNSKPFDVFHYNGLARQENPVRYHKGSMKILEIGLDLEILDIGDDANKEVDSDSPIVRCLRTKYPRVEIVWEDRKIPSMN